MRSSHRIPTDSVEWKVSLRASVLHVSTGSYHLTSRRLAASAVTCARRSRAAARPSDASARRSASSACVSRSRAWSCLDADSCCSAPLGRDHLHSVVWNRVTFLFPKPYILIHKPPKS